MDRTFALLWSTRRYRCRNTDCGWEGRVDRGAQQVFTRAAVWLAILALALVAALVTTSIVTHHLTTDKAGADYD